MREVFEIEKLEKFRRRTVEERPARHVFARDGANQIALEQSGDHSVDVNAANGFDLGLGDRLAVGDDRESFESRCGPSAPVGRREIS